MRAIFPVFVGELQSQHCDVYDNFFDDGGVQKCRDEVVGRVEEKHLKSIADFQGAFFRGSSADAMHEIVVRIRDLVMKPETETEISAGECAVSPTAVAVRPSAEQQDDRAQPSASQGRLPIIEGFFCKKIADKKQLLRDIEAVKSADPADKDERLTQLEAQLKALETIDVHKEAQELKRCLSGGRRVFEVSVNPQPSFDTFKSIIRSAKELKRTMFVCCTWCSKVAWRVAMWLFLAQGSGGVFRV